MPSDALPLVGRDAELLALARHHAAVVERRHGRIVIVSGDAGIGKSRLVREFIVTADRPSGVGGAVDLGEQTIPLLPVRLALRDLVSADRTQLAEGFASAATGLTDALDQLGDPELAGAILVLEDLHWADPSTLAFVRLLAAQLGSSPVLVIVTHRVDMERGHPLRATLADLARSPDAFRLELAPLGPEEIALLHLRRHGELADQATLDLLWQRAGGNPFFTIELLDSDPAGFPASVDDVVTHQIEQLPSPVLSLVRTVAAAGRIRVDLAVELVDLHGEMARDAVGAATAAGVVRVERGEIQLRHALLAEAVERTMLPAERRAAHARLAELAEANRLVDSDSAVDGSARRARHWQLAGRPDRAIPAAIAAAAAATSAHAHPVALAQYEAVLDMWDADVIEAHGVRLDDVLIATSRAAFESGRSELAIRCAGRAVEIATDDDTLAAAATALALAEFGAARLGEARTTIHERLDDLLDREPSAAIVELALAGVGMAITHGEYAAAAEPDPRIIAAAQVVGQQSQLGRLAGYRGASMVALGRIADGLAMLDRGIDILSSVGAVDDALAATANRVLVGAFTDDLDTLIAIAERGRRLVEDGASPWRVAALDAVYADVLTRNGRLGDADLALAGTARRYAWRTSLEVALAAALLAVERDDPEAALALLDRPDTAVADQHPPAVLRRDVLRVRAELMVESPARSDPDLLPERLLVACRSAPVTALALDGPRALTVLEQLWRPGASWTAVLDETNELVRRATRLARPASHVASELALATAHRIASHEPERASAAWRVAIETASTSGCRLVAAEARLGLARTLVASGHRTEARELLDRVEADSEEIGAMRLGRVAGDLRRRARLGRASSSSEAFGLTDREQEVLALVAQGWSNGEIGEALYISTKTASVHVSNLLRKLDVPNRRAAARLAAELGLDRAVTEPTRDGEIGP